MKLETSANELMRKWKFRTLLLLNGTGRGGHSHKLVFRVSWVRTLVHPKTRSLEKLRHTLNLSWLKALTLA
ncbi:hypothetical protein TNCV_2645551 [Trichonephila clavipes]|nr:hypothetical protein TNCV_2645551 [Trichonephila clavipes]